MRRKHHIITSNSLWCDVLILLPSWMFSAPKIIRRQRISSAELSDACLTESDSESQTSIAANSPAVHLICQSAAPAPPCHRCRYSHSSTPSHRLKLSRQVIIHGCCCCCCDVIHRSRDYDALTRTSIRWLLMRGTEMMMMMGDLLACHMVND